MRAAERLARPEAAAKSRIATRDPDACPPWREPEAWASRVREGDMLMMFARGEPVVPPPGSTPEEVGWVEAVLDAARQLEAM